MTSNDVVQMDTSGFYDMESVPVEIEVLDELDVPADELSQFIETDSISILENNNIKNNFDDLLINEDEEILIKKLINGELTFTEYKNQIGRNDDNIEIDEYDDENLNEVTLETDKTPKENDGENLQSASSSRKDDDIVKRQKRKRSVLPPALMGLMGEANLCFARGDTKLAEQACFEIIRQVPLAPEPFLTLAQIYETTDPEKCMQFSLIAAHLNPGDTDLWIRLAEQSIEQHNTNQAISRLTQAIKGNTKNIDIRIRRIQLLESIGLDKLAFRCTYKMLTFIPKESGAFLLKTAKTVAEKFSKDNNYEKALHSLSIAYDRVPELFQMEDINILCELQIFNNNYKNVLDILSQYIGFDITIEEIIDETTRDLSHNVEQIVIPDDIILDFRTKLIVSLIHLKSFKILDYIIDNAIKFIDVEDAGDCHLDIAEALMKERCFSNALKLLIPLVNSKNFSLAAVWLRHADCYRAIGEIENAIKSYKIVVQLAPQHLDARLVLAALLKQQGLDMEALKVLEQNLETDLLDPKLLYERCFILREAKFQHELLEVGLLLISRHCIKLRNREEMMLVAVLSKIIGRKFRSIKEHRQIRSQNIDDNDEPEFTVASNKLSTNTTSSQLKEEYTDNLTLELEWDLFLHLLQIATELKRYNMTQKLAFLALTSKNFQPYMAEIEFYALQSSIMNRDAEVSYKLIREFLAKYFNNKKVWNLFNVITQTIEDLRYSRFLIRVLNRKDPPHTLVHLFQANYFLMVGSYKYALNDYLSVYKKTNCAMAALLCGVSIGQLACQKCMAKKHTLLKEAISFFYKYKELRKNQPEYEVDYNFGRFYQQFSMSNLAILHYNKVLEYDYDSDGLYQKHSKYLNLRLDAAFNLHLIYKNSGNLEMARNILYDNIVI